MLKEYVSESPDVKADMATRTGEPGPVPTTGMAPAEPGGGGTGRRPRGNQPGAGTRTTHYAGLYASRLPAA
jgi:hypothetical protein